MLLALSALCLLPALAADLPGVALQFDVDADGRWTTPAALPERFAQAGVQPGWILKAVEGVKFEDPLSTRRRVAAGPARHLQLEFDTPEGETVLLVERQDLVQLEEVGLLPWPQGFQAPATAWVEPGSGVPWLRDSAGAVWSLDVSTGAWTRVPEGSDKGAPRDVPEVWWSLSDAPWVVSRPLEVTLRSSTETRKTLAKPARLRRFQGRTGDHLVVPEADGLDVLAVTWPRGTPELPECVPDLPETCLVTGTQVAGELSGRPGGRAEALRALGVACTGGVYRACLESVVLEQPDLALQARSCLQTNPNACHQVARARTQAEPDAPGDILIGVLEYACTVDSSGSLGQRLRRLEDVGEGCMLLSSAFDRARMPDRALLSLDQACVLGRAEACDEAGRRRKEAFALRTVRECEDATLPLAASCVQLGRLLQEGPVQATKLDDFGAFERACQLGDEDGCVLLGDYVDRWGISNPRVAEAERVIGEACARGEQRACVGSAHLLVRHDPRSAAYGEALRLFSAACTAGLPSACIAGAEQRRIGKARKVDAPEPLAMWTAACDQHSPAGCAGLGEKLARSKRTRDDAFQAWSKACETGSAAACTDLGLLVDAKHKPTWPGEQAPEAYLQRGCENADAEGCFWLAWDDVPRRGDPSEPTYLLLERSCDGEFGRACATLGRVHMQRRTNFDFEIAASHFQTACDNGHFESCKALSEMYQKGRGVEKDRVRAKELAQRYSVNARRHHVRVGAHVGFPYVGGGEGEIVLPVPVGPALAATGSYSYLPYLGGVMLQLQGEEYPDVVPDLQYMDAGVRLYPNNKARGLYAMVGVHRIEALNGLLLEPIVRDGLSARMGMYSETRFLYTRVEMGIAQYGMIYLNDFDEDETGAFPLIQATLGFSVGFAVF